MPLVALTRAIGWAVDKELVLPTVGLTEAREAPRAAIVEAKVSMGLSGGAPPARDAAPMAAGSPAPAPALGAVWASRLKPSGTGIWAFMTLHSAKGSLEPSCWPGTGGTLELDGSGGGGGTMEEMGGGGTTEEVGRGGTTPEVGRGGAEEGEGGGGTVVTETVMVGVAGLGGIDGGVAADSRALAAAAAAAAHSGWESINARETLRSFGLTIGGAAAAAAAGSWALPVGGPVGRYRGMAGIPAIAVGG